MGTDFDRMARDEAPDAVIITSLDGLVQHWSAGAQVMFGYSSTEAIGRSLQDLIVPSELVDEECQIRQRIVASGISSYESLRQKKDRSLLYVEVTGKAVRNAPGDCEFILFCKKEITFRRVRCDALQEKNTALESANLAKDHFLAGMSHELRTPLNAILGFTGTLLMRLPGPLTADQDKQLKIIQSSAHHLLSLINDVLDLAKIDAGKLALTIEKIVCQDLISEVVESLGPLAIHKGLVLRCAVPANPLSILTDARALRQILINLISNAIKFTETGEIVITLSQQSAEGQHRMSFSVTDSGVGIQMTDQVKLFRMFLQVDTSPIRYVEGTGLGLYLSQKLAALIGGELRCESQFGVGSVFTLSLPGP